MTLGKLRMLNSWPVWIGLMLLLPGCSLISSKVDPFTCTVSVAYKQDGTVDHDAYAVNRACLRGVQKRLEACYKE